MRNKFLISSLIILATVSSLANDKAGNGADGISADEIVFQVLEQAGAEVLFMPTVQIIEVNNLNCSKDSGHSYIDICSAQDLSSGKKLSFRSNNFVSFLGEIDPEIGSISSIRCQKNLLPPTAEDLDENGYYNPTNAFKCSLK